MIGQTPPVTESDEPASASGEGAPTPVPDAPKEERPVEIGGRAGPEPTRYGDWEKNGRCIDF